MCEHCGEDCGEQNGCQECGIYCGEVGIACEHDVFLCRDCTDRHYAGEWLCDECKDEASEEEEEEEEDEDEIEEKNVVVEEPK